MGKYKFYRKQSEWKFREEGESRWAHVQLGCEKKGVRIWAPKIIHEVCFWSEAMNEKGEPRIYVCGFVLNGGYKTFDQGIYRGRRQRGSTRIMRFVVPK